MKKRIIIIYLLILLPNVCFTQNITLKLSSKKKSEKLILQNLDFKKIHKNITSINLEVSKISSYLKMIGYFTNTIDSVTKKNKKHTYYFSLNQKIDIAQINIPPNLDIRINKKIKNNTLTISIQDLKPTLENISQELENKGETFSKIKIKNIKIKNKTLLANLEIIKSEKRTIDKITIKGYEKFPKSYIKNYFNINNKTTFNKETLKKISNLTKNIVFINEIKPPETLFTKDSTQLYIYLQKKKNNTFNGLINFSSQENGKLSFNGNLDLKLNNIIDTGEILELTWNSTTNERQDFKISTELPYIFNTKLTPKLSFSIYKQDSTFLNTKFDTKLYYNINQRTKTAITYNTENSEELNKLNASNITSFNSIFLGLQVEYNIPNNDLLFNNKFNLKINPSFGNRKTLNEATNQFKIEATISYIWEINKRNNIYINNETGYLNSDNILDNELFRIGGTNSLRGFNEQSVITDNYTYFNIEYRYLTSRKSYLYTITDIGKVNVNKEKENLISIGIGYLFTTKNSQINISTFLGKKNNQNFDLNKSKISINWKSFF